VSERIYRRVLKHKIFAKYKKDHCMCSTCLKAGWRGIDERGHVLLKLMDSWTCWPRTGPLF
jgi:hypothetical protein